MSSDIPSAKGRKDDSLNTCPSLEFSSECTSSEKRSNANLSSEEGLSILPLEVSFTNASAYHCEDGCKTKYPRALSNVSKEEIDVPLSLGQKSSLFQHKENHEVSPFKEALKGFVRSRLAKLGNTENLGNLDSDKRTLFSGIKQKIVKKLEDNSTKEIVYIRDSSFDTLDVYNSPTTSCVTVKNECELKSVVANDHSESTVVEEAEECFEEVKAVQISNSTPCGNVTTGEASATVATTDNRISMTAAAVQLQLISDKSLLNKCTDFEKKKLDIDVNTVESETHLSCSDSFEALGYSALTNCSSPSAELKCGDIPDNSLITESTHLERNLSFSVKMLERILRLLESLKNSALADISVLLIAIVTYYFFFNHPFFAGLLCGILFAVFFWLLYSQFTHSLMSSNGVSALAYKSLPPVPKLLLSKKTFSHEGWMNQLNGEYKHDSFQLTDTVSVFVCIQDDKLFLSYPKKNVPRQAMWNEKDIHNNPIVREEMYTLQDGKILLLPHGLQHTRIWNKRYPLCVILPKEQNYKGADSLDSGSELEEKQLEVSPKLSSSNISQSGSLPSTPVNLCKNTVFYLFARADHEKEEWYWKFHYAMGFGDDHPSDITCQDHVSPGSSPESGTAPCVSQVQKSFNMLPPKEEAGKPSLMCDRPLHKPVLNFDLYMTLLIKQELERKSNVPDREESHVQWLNVFLGRLFFDFFVQKKWADRVMERIQYKLDRIKMPQYMQKLVVTDVYLGTCLPQIQNASEAVVDERGLWLDFDISYQGYFQMTLETKFKSLKRPAGKHQGEETIPELSESVNEDLSECWDDEEDVPDSEITREESPSHHSSVSTGTKLLQSVEKWVISTNIAENSFVKRCVGQLMQARLLLTVEVSNLNGTLAVNIPPLPTDRLWYGFRTNPELSLNVLPKVGDRHISLLPVVQLIKKKLLQEFQRALVMPNMDDLLVPIMHSTVYDQ